MKTIKDLIDSIEEAEHQSKAHEQNNDIDKIKGVLNDIISKIDSYLKANVSRTEEEVKVLIALKKCYSDKHQNFAFHSSIAIKEQMIQAKLKEKYLNYKDKDISFIDYQGNALNPSAEQNEGFFMNNKMIGKDFEVVNPDQVMLNEISTTCDVLLKKFEEEFNSKAAPKDEFVNKMKTMESFYVFEVRKEGLEDRTIVMKYIDNIKQIKEKCDLLKSSRISDDIKAIIKLEEEIKTINDEIAKINARNQSQMNFLKRSKLKCNTYPVNNNDNK